MSGPPTDLPAGIAAVVKARRIAAPPSRVWACLSVPALVAQWFADVSRLAPGETFLFRFDDGDFFAGRVTQWVEETTLGLEWKFMGIGPEFTICYTVAPTAGGETALTVTDRGAPTHEEAQALREGWDDFLDRLDRFLATGRPTRFVWSDTFAASALLRSDRVPEWPPELDDPREWLASAFPDAEIAIRQRGSQALNLTFSDRAWDGRTTEATLHATATALGLHLAVTHVGWPRLADGRRIEQRRRYAALWSAALAGLEERYDRPCV